MLTLALIGLFVAAGIAAMVLLACLAVQGEA